MKIDLIAGTRPNLIKVAPLIEVLKLNRDIDLRFIYTGQHYDEELYSNVMKSLGLPVPDIDFKIQKGNFDIQISQIMTKYSDLTELHKVDACIVVGDVDSTLACSLIAARKNISLMHVEAGLRSFDKKMPEEINRIIVDSISNLLFTPSVDATDNLVREGKSLSDIVFVGNIMIDTLKKLQETFTELKYCKTLKLSKKEYVVATFHRASNVDDRETLIQIVENLVELSCRIPVIVSTHPRLMQRLTEYSLLEKIEAPNLFFLRSLDYLQFMSLVNDSRFVITDSGGVQEETTFLGIPCLTYRENTERPITIVEGTNTLVNATNFAKITESTLNTNKIARNPPELWDGQTAKRIYQTIKERYL